MYNNSIVWEEPQASTDRIFDGVEYIHKAFDKYDIVGIGESHGVEQVTDFYIELVRSDDFVKNVDVIVFEFGNSLYQEDLDDYILGISKDATKVKKLWREHTSSFLASGDRTGTIRFLEEVRKVNMMSEHKVRVLAAEVPIEWSNIMTSEDLFAFVGMREQFYGDLVISEILHKNKKAFLIMGSGHFNKSKPHKGAMDNPITAILKASDKNLVLINTMTMDGFPFSQLPKMENGELIETTHPIVGNLKLGVPFIEDLSLKVQTDALLYLGERMDLKYEVPMPFNDPVYEAERQRRRDLIQVNNGQ